MKIIYQKKKFQVTIKIMQLKSCETPNESLIFSFESSPYFIIDIFFKDLQITKPLPC